ncbi:hypothetical protein WICMUC_004925 [Wickerhamomyces mucosus]|uniref:Phosphatidylinositol transfer protein SFH5 n=1 Tax=Wickerhamomyces mucosus TaxID=1378264 RepID=A0A9P8PFF3_9ASCO|nr:hypothetical protein WICMUC_004925 [Wickerhamomyces mucosus]
MATTKTVKFIDDNQKSIFTEFIAVNLPKILKDADYDELYGHQLTEDGEFFIKDVRDSLIFKFLIANNFDVPATETQLTNTLKWRKEFKPLEAAFLEKHDSKFDNIGVLTYYDELKEIITWNLYGETDDQTNVKPGELFEDLDKFLRYRVGLMERALQLSKFDDIDLNKISQVHDYKGVSFLRFDPKVKAGSKLIIKTFQDYYPELLNKKYFVNVPLIAQWIYDLISRAWLPTETSSKFTLLNNAKDLRSRINTDKIPVKYGGKGELLNTQTVKDIEQTPYTSFILNNKKNIPTTVS